MIPKGVKLINGKEPLLRQMVFEIRYDNGYLYFDRCGKILNAIAKEAEEWVVGGQVNPQSTQLYSLRNGSRLVFNASSCSVHMDRSGSENLIKDEDVSEFSAQTTTATSIVIDELGLQEFSRVGFRAWYHFACDSKQEADDWIRELGVCTVDERMITSYGGSLENLSLGLVISGADNRIRIGFDSIELPSQLEGGPDTINVRASKLPKDQKNFLRQRLKECRRVQISTRYAASIDFDGFLEETSTVNAADFIQNHYRLYMTKLGPVLSAIKKPDGKKG